MYKKALHGFFLKVHPDFFHQQRELQRVNEASIAQLNELLNWARDFKAGTLRPPPSTRIDFTFYRKLDADEAGPATASSAKSGRTTTTTSSGVGGVTPKVATTFELPATFAPTDANRTVAERAVNKFLRDLLRRADCIDDASAAVSEAQDRSGADELRAQPKRGGVRARRRREGGPKAPRTLMEDAAESLAEQWVLPQPPTVDELVAADQIMLSRQLSPVESAAAVQTLVVYLPAMMYERWAGMPLLIARHWGVGDVTGTLSIPWDFTLDRFLAFLNTHDARLAECREASEAYARRVESLIAEICRELELDDVLISCQHAAAMPCLELIHANIKHFLNANVRKLTLEVGTKFGYRKNGVVIVDCNATKATLRAALRTIAPHGARLQRIYGLAKTMLEAVEWHLKQIHANLEPAAIDVTTTGASYADRLRFAKELYRISPQLSQWDWSEVTFLLSDELRLDWGAGVMALPAAFDGLAFVRYVGGIHEGAKTAVRDRLAQESAEAEAQLERQEAERRRAAALLPDMYGRGGAGLDDGAVPADELRAALEAQRARSASLAAHGAEYLAADPRGDDELTVERPLHHADVSFASGTDATDQLVWEGFYKSDFADLNPAADEDDEYRAYRAMNRKHREEAVKEVIREMREESGRGGRRFKVDKLGDVLGLNDYTKTPRGFPTLMKGTNPPKPPGSAEHAGGFTKQSRKPPHMR